MNNDFSVLGQCLFSVAVVQEFQRFLPLTHQCHAQGAKQDNEVGLGFSQIEIIDDQTSFGRSYSFPLSTSDVRVQCMCRITQLKVSKPLEDTKRLCEVV